MGTKKAANKSEGCETGEFVPLMDELFLKILFETFQSIKSSRVSLSVLFLSLSCVVLI